MMVPADPLLVDAWALTVGTVMAAAAISKLRAPESFRQALADYAILPEALVPGFGWAFAVSELLAGALLIWPSALRAAAALGCAALLTLASAAVLINLLRGRTRIDCGCGGSADHLPLSWSLLARNACLIVPTLALGWSVADRARGWLDVAGTCMSAAFLVALYAICNQLMINHALSDQRRIAP